VHLIQALSRQQHLHTAITALLNLLAAFAQASSCPGTHSAHTSAAVASLGWTRKHLAGSQTSASTICRAFCRTSIPTHRVNVHSPPAPGSPTP
jgi:hypothetical protein